MKIIDKDKELEELKERIREIVGDSRIEKINQIVDKSYEFDEKPKYKITVIRKQGGEYAVEERNIGGDKKL